MKIITIVIWLNLNTNELYHKIYKTHFTHPLDYINQYNHKVLYIVTYSELFERHKFLKRLLRKFISFLEKIIKKL